MTLPDPLARAARIHPGADGSRILLDVAHNPAGIWTLRSYLSSLFCSDNVTPRHLIFGALRGKSMQAMAQVPSPLFTRPTDRIHFVTVDNPRAAALDKLKAAADAIDTPTSTHVSVADAIKDTQASRNSIIVIAGSIYLVAEARALLLGHGQNYGTYGDWRASKRRHTKLPWRLTLPTPPARS